jgi:hypothetical protein
VDDQLIEELAMKQKEVDEYQYGQENANEE